MEVTMISRFFDTKLRCPISVRRAGEISRESFLRVLRGSSLHAKRRISLKIIFARGRVIRAGRWRTFRLVNQFSNINFRNRCMFIEQVDFNREFHSKNCQRNFQTVCSRGARGSRVEIKSAALQQSINNLAVPTELQDQFAALHDDLLTSGGLQGGVEAADRRRIPAHPIPSRYLRVRRTLVRESRLQRAFLPAEEHLSSVTTHGAARRHCREDIEDTRRVVY